MKVRHKADNRVHFSDLKHFALSPADYKWACENPKPLTRPMLVGLATDCLVFGNQSLAIYPGKVRNGKEWEAFERDYSTDIIVNQAEYDDAKGAADAVLADPVARSVLEGCEFQPCAQWEAYGLECASGIPGKRGGFDAMNLERGYTADLKATITAPTWLLKRHADRMLWNAQGAWFVDGAQANGWPIVRHKVITVRANPPYLVTVLTMTEAKLEEGRQILTGWCEQLRACERTNYWPGPEQNEVEWDVEERGIELDTEGAFE